MIDEIIGSVFAVLYVEYRLLGLGIMVLSVASPEKKRETCDRPLVVTESVYWWLTGRKSLHRVHSIDAVLRKEMPQMIQDIGSIEIQTVRRYSDEGPIHVNKQRPRRKNRS